MTEPLFRPSDFENLSHFFIVENSTSSQTIADPHLIERIAITELYDRGLQLTLPSGICAVGHILLVSAYPAGLFELYRKAPNQVVADQSNESFRATAKVTELRTTQKMELVDLEFRQYVEKDWQAFKKSYQSRQEALQTILKRMQS